MTAKLVLTLTGACCTLLSCPVALVLAGCLLLLLLCVSCAGRDDLFDANLGGRSHELVATGRPAHGADEPALAEGREELVQVLLGNVATERDLRRLERAAAIVARELDESAEAVITSC